MKELTIQITNISKKYSLKGINDHPTLWQIFFQPHKNFWALKNINFKIKKGEKIGIIGLNGSGKTTLLKIIAGIVTPTKGKIKSKGKIVSMINLQAGFNLELSGKDNIFLSGLLLGMKKKEIKENFSQIVDFSGLGKFIKTPLYTYSEGMTFRLGISIALHANPEILIGDDVSSFADDVFRRKIESREKKLKKENGLTAIFSSHELEYISGLCSRIIWLEKGKIKKIGLPKEIISAYKKTYNKKIRKIRMKHPISVPF
jgi:ABC-type polysaccharide/polyol phosphate transport system ATPase subunit